MSDGYPFIFQMIDKSESDEYLIQTLQYRFKSDKSHHAYIVRVECYKKHAYCVKFFDKANINSKNKFSLRSNTFEVRTILYTMFHIMLVSSNLRPPQIFGLKYGVKNNGSI